MKITRIFLFASPLLLLIPPLIPTTDNAGWAVFAYFLQSARIHGTLVQMGE